MHSELVAQARQLDIDRDVEFMGFVANPYAWMAACGVYVLFTYEGFPNSLIQAMACRASVVSTDCPHGPREIVEAIGRGALVSVGDFVAISKEIMKSLDMEKSNTNLDTYNKNKVIMTYENFLLDEIQNINYSSRPS